MIIKPSIIIIPKPIVVAFNDSFWDHSWGSVLIVLVDLIIFTSKKMVYCSLNLYHFRVLSSYEEISVCNNWKSISSVSGCWWFFAGRRHFGRNDVNSRGLFLFKCLFWRKSLLDNIFNLFFLRRTCRSCSSLKWKAIWSCTSWSWSYDFFLNISCSWRLLNTRFD